MSTPFAPVVNFLPYQRAWINDQSRFKIGMFARQTVAQLDIAGRDRVYDAFMFVGVFLGQTVIE